MTAFHTAAARPATRRSAVVLAFLVTVGMLTSVSALSTQEYRQALTAQAAVGTTVAHVATPAAAAAHRA